LTTTATEDKCGKIERNGPNRLDVFLFIMKETIVKKRYLASTLNYQLLNISSEESR